MKVQRVQILDGTQITWLVLGDDYLPVAPIEEFLTYLRSVERSPNTVKAYAYHLKLYWEFLFDEHLSWTAVGLTELANFVAWLRHPNGTQSKVASLDPQEAKRTEVTVNTILTAVCMFYDYHERTETVSEIPLYQTQLQPGRRYKSFLHHINKGKPIRTRLIKLKEPKHALKTLTLGQVEQVIAACHRLRDKFLVCLLYESGMRIGQALGLRHQDIQSWDNLIQVIPRGDNPNYARAKSLDTNRIHVSRELMELYCDYLLKEFDSTDSDFVFVNLWEGKIGAPLCYGTVSELFRRISKSIGFPVHPHLLRHTHASELARVGWDASRIQKRLGHRQVQTALNTYIHLSDDDLKDAYDDYLKQKGRVDYEQANFSLDKRDSAD